MIRVKVQDLGPIHDAEVDAESLTVFIGPNNSGKSFLATILYAVFSTPYQTSELGLPFFSLLYHDPVASPTVVDEFATLLAEDEHPRPASFSDAMLAFSQVAVHDGLNDFGKGIIRLMERGFGSSVVELRRSSMGKGTARLVVEDEELAWRVGISVGTRGPRVYVKDPDVLDVLHRLSRGSWRRVRTRAGIPSSPTFPRRALQAFRAELVRAALRGLRPALYMPAARSGLMQSQRALAGAIVRRASYAGIEDVQVPALSGVVADFLSRLITLSRSSGGFGKEADRLEQDILKGHLRLVDAPNGFPEIVFSTNQGDFPLHRTSSMISELAPVVLMLRGVLEEGECLIIEEPEAHLHPASQVGVAQSISRLVNANLQVILTTHSEFFLQQLNNAILASSVNRRIAGRLGLGAERLQVGEVAAYLFDSSEGGRGTYVRRLAVTPEEGIPEAGFAAVAEALYNQTVALDRATRRG